ncbi:MAG: type II 3-dehydroquinate dehydratase [Pseudaminobacter sp.]
MADTLHIDVLNGPNTNLYGLDPSGPYGKLTLADIEERCRAKAQALGASVRFLQSSIEGELIDWIHEARGKADGIVINAGSLSYTSIGLMDALASFGGPSFQVHVSNVFKREPIRHYSPISQAVTGCLIGLGPKGYEFAVEAIVRTLRDD